MQIAKVDSEEQVRADIAELEQMMADLQSR